MPLVASQIHMYYIWVAISIDVLKWTCSKNSLPPWIKGNEPVKKITSFNKKNQPVKKQDWKVDKVDKVLRILKSSGQQIL